MEKQKVDIPHQLGSIIQDMEKCLKSELFYPALLIALTIPDICVALTTTSDVFLKEKHYSDFIDKYGKGLGLDGQSCYRLRGGVVHRGNAVGHPFFGFTHVVFTTPSSQAHIHGLTIQLADGTKNAAMFDLEHFCSGMKNAALDWYAENKDEPLVKANMPALLSLRPRGISPWVVGTPVVASGLD